MQLYLYDHFLQIPPDLFQADLVRVLDTDDYSVHPEGNASTILQLVLHSHLQQEVMYNYGQYNIIGVPNMTMQCPVVLWCVLLPR